MIRAAGLAILFVTAWTEMTQADFSENIRRCDSDDSHPDIRIAACTRNIESGRFTGKNLAVAFTKTSHPSSYLPLYFSMYSEGACKGSCGALNDK